MMPKILIVLLFSLLTACGQKGPLFMPIEDTKTEQEGAS